VPSVDPDLALRRAAVARGRELAQTYLHARSRRTDATRMTKAFAGDGLEPRVRA